MARTIITASSDQPNQVVGTISLDELYDKAQESTEGRVAFVSQLYSDLIQELRQFYQCRETSLAVTNLEQSGMWWQAAGEKWRDAGHPA